MTDRTKTGTGPRLLSGGNPQIPKGEGDGPVQVYIAAMPGWKRDVGKCRSEHGHQSTLVGGSHLLRHAHAPRVHEQLLQLDDVDGVEPDADPSVPHVSDRRHEELVGLRGNQCLPHLPGEAEAHDRVVVVERGVDDAADPKFHLAAYDG